MGRKAYQPTAEQRAVVKSLAGYGIPQREIAKHLGINLSTLVKHFEKELDDGLLTANAKVAGALYKNAMEGNAACQIFWCKARLGWRETDRHEVTGADGKDLVPQITISIKPPST